jgi:membrane associated rhomboid family serine protease
LTLDRVPAFVLIGLWLLSQLLNGAASIAYTSATSEDGVAYWAHVGGFVFGLVATSAFMSRRADGQPSVSSPRIPQG